MRLCLLLCFFFFFNDTATTEIYTLSLHDALPIWSYLAVKIVSVIVLVPLLWIEGSRVLWNLITADVLRAWSAGFGATVAFLGGFGLAAIWVFDDQRRRCPVCLRRLARPVTMGSWASMFEPVTTEFLCDEGHGALSLAESELGEGDRWVSLDASWREF